MIPMHSLAKRLAHTCTLVGIGLLAASCRADDGSVTISGDVDGLDTLAFRGDSLLAQAERMPAQIDSLRAIIDGAMPGVTPIIGDDSLIQAMAGTLTAPTPSPAIGGAALTRRAQARGDSMARAAAQKFASTASASSRARADSVRGVIRLLGSEPARQPVLQVAGETAPMMLSGMATSGLQRLEGADVVVLGLQVSPRDIVVAEYIVRGMKGVPAYDGVLQVGESGYALVLSDGSGSKRFASLPEPLRGLSGARVWIAVPEGDAAPRAYGIIGRR